MPIDLLCLFIYLIRFFRLCRRHHRHRRRHCRRRRLHCLLFMTIEIKYEEEILAVPYEIYQQFQGCRVRARVCGFGLTFRVRDK